MRSNKTAANDHQLRLKLLLCLRVPLLLDTCLAFCFHLPPYLFATVVLFLPVVLSLISSGGF